MSDLEHEPDGTPRAEPESDESEHAPEGEPASAPADGTLGPGEAEFAEDAEGDEELLREGPGLAGTVTLAPQDLRGALEALILVSDKPVAAIRLARMTRQDVGVVRRALEELREEYHGRGIVLDEIAGGFQFRTSPRYAPFVRNLVDQKPTKLSRAQLEVLAIIAYRQPITRPEIEDVRGVDSGSALKVLLERNVIKIIGKKDEAGRPMLYGTTNDFLELFGLKNLRDLPTLKEFTELSAESRDMFERRIGGPLPGVGQGMDLQTHYEAPAARGEEGEEASDAGAEASEEASESGGEASAEAVDAPEQKQERAEPGDRAADADEDAAPSPAD